MSVLIKGMEMPTSCADCRFYGEYCHAKGDENKHSKLPCPLVPIPDHGRLISAELLKAEFTGNFIEAYPTALVLAMIDDAPTIIPAEGRATQVGD